MRELHWPAKTEQKLALGGWHSANALALLFDLVTGSVTSLCVVQYIYSTFFDLITGSVTSLYVVRYIYGTCFDLVSGSVTLLCADGVWTLRISRPGDRVPRCCDPRRQEEQGQTDQSDMS